MLDACQSQINAFYGKYADKEGISLSEAKKRVRELDIKAYERKAKRYVAEKDFSPQANEEMRLYNATMKINRLEMLKANIGLELIDGHDQLEKFMSGILKDRTMDELKRQAGILGKTVRNNAQKAHAIVNGSFHSGTFSDRIWQYQDLMREDLGRLLQTGLIQGKNPRAITKDLKKYWYGADPKTGGGAVYCMERLMRTELARVQTEAQKQSFERNNFDEYEFIANGGCCPICQALHGKHFKVSKMMPGENAPPMHPQCRCSTAAYSDRKEYEEWLDFLDKGGTTEEFKKKKAKEEHIETFKKAATIEEAAKYASDTLHLDQTTAYSLGMNVDVANALNEAILRINDKFGSITESGYLENVLIYTKSGASYAAYHSPTRSLFLNKSCKYKSAISKMAEVARGEYGIGTWSTGAPMHSVYHELGHAVQHMILDNNSLKQNQIEVLYNKTFRDIMGNGTSWRVDDPDLLERAKKAKEHGFSFYGLRNSGEFVAEAIAQYFLADEPSEISKNVVNILGGT